MSAPKVKVTPSGLYLLRVNNNNNYVIKLEKLLDPRGSRIMPPPSNFGFCDLEF